MSTSGWVIICFIAWAFGGLCGVLALNYALTREARRRERAD